VIARWVFEIDVGPSLSEPARCRDLLRDHVVATAPAVDLEVALLLASELVTNAVLHGGPPRRMVFRTDGTAFRLEVSDGGSGRPVVLPRQPGLEHGRGMQLVAGLTDRWGVSTHGPGAAGGKTVWAEVDC
jgi:two-component sensor histidine kinase